MKRSSSFALSALAALAVVLLSACTTVNTGPDTGLRTINVNGTGIVYGTPDIATVDIGVETRGENAKRASDENTRRMAVVLSALKELGVEDEDIRTSNFIIRIEEKYDRDGVPTGEREFVINNTVTVKFRDLSKVGEGLQAALDAGANQVANIAFAVEDTAALAAQARDKAMADARARADQLAQAAGVTIDRPYSINESFGYYSSPVRYDVAAVVEAPAAAPVPVQGGQVSVQVDVSVSYLIK